MPNGDAPQPTDDADDDREARWCSGYDDGLEAAPCGFPDDGAYSLGWRSGNAERERRDD